jgi:hypothetical protein
MPDEEIDKIIRDAASQHHPPYDDKAWGKMEILLDKHLPHKKDRKKPVLFLLLFLLLGTALFFAAKNYSTKNNAGIAQEPGNNQPVAAEKNTAIIDAENNDQISTSDQNTAGAIAVPQTPATIITTPVDKTIAATKVNISSTNAAGEKWSGRNKKPGRNKGSFAVTVKKPAAVLDDIAANNQVKDEKPDADMLTTGTKNPALVNAGSNINTNDIITDGQSAATVKTNDSVAVTRATLQKDKADSSTTNTASAKPPRKGNKKFVSNFAITVSAGADLSFIDVNNPGKLKPVYGAGLSYALGKHFTVSSGLYIAKKIYTAQPNQYKFTGYVNPYLTEIDANCKVYEIPLTVYYNFAQVKKHRWLAGAGLSSFLMKTETYDYQYKTPTGQSYNYIRTVSNENEHFFSVLTLSGGYQYKITNRIALTAEPYIKLPLGGVGSGKVKLNSTGILLTTSVKPFIRRK